MAYSINPYLPKARATALHLLIAEGLPLSVVANRCGIHRTTLWRWKRKWLERNKYVSEECSNRPGRLRHKVVRMNPSYYHWIIPTESSRPHMHPSAMPDAVVHQVLAVRETLKRCAEVVWHHLTQVLCVRISVSSVKRIFRRFHIYDRSTRRRRPYHKSLPRPVVTAPGMLVQIDTVHLIDLRTMRRTYVYTVIDLYSRMAHAKVSDRIAPGIAVQTVLEAQDAFGFHFGMVQSDNGSEFSKYFEERLHGSGIQTRHSRLHRPNDNAHVERFNRTIQEECTGRYWSQNTPLRQLQQKVTRYLAYYNTERVHLGIQLRTPAQMLQRF